MTDLPHTCELVVAGSFQARVRSAHHQIRWVRPPLIVRNIRNLFGSTLVET
jgi:hypothetical protein